MVSLQLGAFGTQPGTLSISGGTLSSSGTLTVSNAPGNSLSLSGGTLSVPALALPSLSALNWTGGTLAFTDYLISSTLSNNFPVPAGRFLRVATTLNVPAGATFALTGGSVSLGTVSTNLSPAGFLWSAGTVSFTGNFTPSLTNFGNTLSLTASRTLSVAGSFSTGSTTSFSIDGAALAAARVNIDYNPVSLSAGSLSAGTFTVGGALSTTSHFAQTGGSVAVAQEFNIGRGLKSSGIYSLSAGSSLVAGSESIGVGTLNPGLFVPAGIGTLDQTGGTNTVIQGLYVGYGDAHSGGTGTFNLSAGSVSAAGGVFVGYAGTGALNQTGGTLVADNGSSLALAALPGSKGTYSLSAGDASAANIYVGGSDTAPGGAATLSLAGGTLSTPGTLEVYDTPNTSVAVTGGTLSVGALDTSGNPSRFSWTGGTISVTSSPLSISTAGPLGPSLNLVPAMTLRVAQPMIVAPTSTLSLTGGTLDLTSTSLTWSFTGASPASTIRQQILAGRLTSSSLAPSTSLGYLDTGTAVLVKLTPTGDANLDGKLNADDYALLDKGFSTTGTYWWQGDFDYDGSVTSADYLLIDSTYLQQQGGTPSPDFLSQRESQFGAGYVSSLIASVPEPSSFLAAGGLAFPFLSRRRHRYPAG